MVGSYTFRKMFCTNCTVRELFPTPAIPITTIFTFAIVLLFLSFFVIWFSGLFSASVFFKPKKTAKGMSLFFMLATVCLAHQLSVSRRSIFESVRRSAAFTWDVKRGRKKRKTSNLYFCASSFFIAEMDENDGKLEVTLLGDSTLDNIVWVANTEEAVPAQLKERLGEQAVVINFAADGFNTKDMLEGQVPSISYAARLHADQFPIDEGDAFYPLIFIQGSASTHAVLSVGGNDVREILGRMDLLQESIMQFMINYPIIVSQIVSQIPKLTICLQYRPSVLDSHYGVYQAMAAVPGPG